MKIEKDPAGQRPFPHDTSHYSIVGATGYALRASLTTYLVAAWLGRQTGPTFILYLFGLVGVVVSVSWLVAGRHMGRRLFLVRGIVGLVVAVGSSALAFYISSHTQVSRPSEAPPLVVDVLFSLSHLPTFYTLADLPAWLLALSGGLSPLLLNLLEIAVLFTAWRAYGLRLFAYAGGLASIGAWNAVSNLIPWDSATWSPTLAWLFLPIDVIGALGSACAAAAFLAMRPQGS